MSCSFKLTQHWRAPTRSTYIYHGLVALAGNLWMSCDWRFWCVATFRSPLVQSVALSMPGHWVSACSENAAFIAQIWVKYHLLLKLKLDECTNLSYCYKIISNQWSSNNENTNNFNYPFYRAWCFQLQHAWHTQLNWQNFLKRFLSKQLSL